ncbi:MAG: DinB family protein [Flavobacteriaceae bacterium]|nr:DinB family protein [Flavobacteriaceae bacterium]
MEQLNKDEYNPYYKSYIELVTQNNKGLVKNLKDSLEKSLIVLTNLPKNKYLFRYAEGKWTINEILQHIIDTERIFNYRALRFSRKDLTELVGFDQNLYVDQSNANEREFDSLLDELTILRKSTIHLYESFTSEVLLIKGKSNSNFMSVRALGYITSGHLLHHLDVIKTRYI